MLTNSAEWEAACVKAGQKCGDLVHPLVYCPELHFSEFTSAVADMKNSVAVGVGPARGARCGPEEYVSQKTSVPRHQMSRVTNHALNRPHLSLGLICPSAPWG